MSGVNEKAKYYDVFTISEFVQDRQVKTAWTKVGIAFVNQDGSFNIRLRALPITDLKTGTANLHMRLPRLKEDYANKQELNDDSDMCNYNNSDTQEENDSEYMYDPTDPEDKL